MSKILQQAKNQYRKVLVFEFVCLFIISVVLSVWQIKIGLSWFNGALAAFLPQCAFTYWIFFRQSVIFSQKMTAFYQGEAIKWLVALVGIGVSLACFQLHHMAFFGGYLVMLGMNVLFPMIFKTNN